MLLDKFNLNYKEKTMNDKVNVFADFISDQLVKEGAVSEERKSRPEGIASQPKGAKTSSGVEYDDIKKVKDHFKKHGFHTQNGNKTKEGNHRIGLHTFEDSEARNNPKAFKKAVETSPVPIVNHTTSDKKNGVPSHYIEISPKQENEDKVSTYANFISKQLEIKK